MDWVRTILATMTAIGSAMTAGVFFGFSTLVMPSLDGATQVDAISVMQEINRVAVRSALMPLMFGTAILCVMLLVTSLKSQREVVIFSAAGVAVYIIGVVGVTVFANVPLNDSLARISATAIDPSAWPSYSVPWTLWNSVRAGAGCFGSVFFFAAAHLLARTTSST